MMAVGSQEYDWNLDLGQIAVIWRGGCIIRAAFLDRIRAAYENNAELPTLLTDEDFSKDLADAQEAWRNVVASAVRLGIPGAASTTIPAPSQACNEREPLYVKSTWPGVSIRFRL